MDNPGFGPQPKSALPPPTAADALLFLRRRRWLCLGVFAPILLGAVILAYKLPPVFRSEATILIEQAAIPDDIVPSTINTYVDEQIQVVTQRVLARDNVVKLIEKFDLYPEERKAGLLPEAVARFGTDTFLEGIAAGVVDDRGRAANSTFGFKVGYHASDPIVAQQVTTELAELYLEENARSRKEKAAETTGFLEEEAERLAAEIAEMEQRMSEFKNEYAEALPAQTLFNLQLIDRLDRDLKEVDSEIRDLRTEQQLLYSERQTLDTHATIFSEDGEPLFTAEQRLAELRQEYLQLSSRYGPEHPDVRRAKREIDAIVGSGNVAGSNDFSAQRAALVLERDALLERYSESHPDVKRLERSIEVLDKAAAAAGADGSTARTLLPPNNPLYVQNQSRLGAVSANLSASEQRRQDLLTRRTTIERSIAIAPQVEKEWLLLNRGYNSAREEYDEIRRRGTEARLTERLEAENKGQRYTLLERAKLPSTPIEPNRFAVIFLGLVIALGAGIGVGALADAMDTTVRSVRDLHTNFGIEPLAVIPYLKPTHRWRRSR
jgi:succinoglycan biosynthesis transport protein ExoP